MAAYEFKGGDTFNFVGEFTLKDGSALVMDMTGWTGLSQVRTKKFVLIADLAFSWIDPVNRLFRVQFVGDTEAWPRGEALIDIELTSPDLQTVISTRTGRFLIVNSVTQ